MAKGRKGHDVMMTPRSSAAMDIMGGLNVLAPASMGMDPNSIQALLNAIGGVGDLTGLYEMPEMLRTTGYGEDD